MKKIGWISGVSLLILLGVMIIVEEIQRNSIALFGIMPQEVLVVADQGEIVRFEIDVFMSKRFHKRFESKEIIDAYLYNEDSLVKVEFHTLVSKEHQMDAQGILLDQYVMGFTLDTDDTQVVLWDLIDAKMEIHFSSNEVIRFRVGNVWLEKSFYLEQHQSSIQFTRLRGFGKTTNSNQTLGGFILGIRNLHEEDIVITSVAPKHPWLRVDAEEVQILSPQDQIITTNLDTYLGYSYDIFAKKEDKEYSCVIVSNTEVQLFFPLLYEEETTVSLMSFRIIYTIGTQTYMIDKSPFLFFLSLESNAASKKMVFYKWNELS